LPIKDQFGDYQGAIVHIDIDNPKELTLPNQIGFPNKYSKNEYEFITMDELEKTKNLEERLKNLLYKKDKIKIISKNDKELNNSLDRLKKLKIKGSNFKVLDKKPGFPANTTPDNTIWVKIKGTIDKEILRDIAKIAFNYLAYSKGEEYVLKDKFDDIRKFIKIGENKKNISFVLPNAQHILNTESDKIKFFDGFLIVIERKNNDIIARLSLFNDLTYIVFLSIGSEILWLPDFNCGHSYNHKTKVLKKLGSFTFLKPSNTIFK